MLKHLKFPNRLLFYKTTKNDFQKSFFRTVFEKSYQKKSYFRLHLNKHTIVKILINKFYNSNCLNYNGT